MTINDRSASPSLQMQEALIIAITELLQADDVNVGVRIVDLIQQLRQNHNLFHLNDRVIQTSLWTDLRNEQTVLAAVMNATTTFLLELDDTYQCVEHFAKCLVPFSNSSSIVDDEVKKKAPSENEVESMLQNNLWLFFMTYASTQLRLINNVLLQLNVKVGP